RLTEVPGPISGLRTSRHASDDRLIVDIDSRSSRLISLSGSSEEDDRRLSETVRGGLPQDLALSMSDARSSISAGLCDPYAEFVSTGSGYRANDGARHPRDISFLPGAACAMRNPPWLVGVAEGALQFGRREGGASVAKVPLPPEIVERLSI